jgi:hypothetical protein
VAADSFAAITAIPDLFKARSFQDDAVARLLRSFSPNLQYMTHDAKTKIVSVERFVPAAPGPIFEVLADPRQHSKIDGSGTVKAAKVSAPPRLSLGAKFTMDMKIGVPYKMTSTVVEFEENRLIAWQHFGGHIWRYILEAVDGGTKVTEQFDYNGSKSILILKLKGSVKSNEKFMAQTLDNIVKHFSTQS